MGFAESLEEAQLNFCRKLVDAGNYQSSGNQLLCHKYFDLAPGYLIKCLRYEQEGYPSNIDQRACDLYLNNLEDWGPWQDYEVPEDVASLLDDYQGIYRVSFVKNH